MKKENLILIIIALIIIGIILIINYARGNPTLDDETMQCIAENSILFVSKTCGHCANQKQILGDSLDLFEVNDVSEEAELTQEYGITVVPTWIINKQKYKGVHSIKQLKELTGC